MGSSKEPGPSEPCSWPSSPRSRKTWASGRAGGMRWDTGRARSRKRQEALPAAPLGMGLSTSLPGPSSGLGTAGGHKPR